MPDGTIPPMPPTWPRWSSNGRTSCDRPRGTGKTLLVNALAEALNVPVVVGDATTFTEAGYVGADVETLLTSLFLAAGGDFGRCRARIVFIDEVDKIAARNWSGSLRLGP